MRTTPWKVRACVVLLAAFSVPTLATAQTVIEPGSTSPSREVERMMKAAGDNRYGHRDATMVLLAFRHGFRASELCALRWDQVDLVHGRLHCLAAQERNALGPSAHWNRTECAAPVKTRTRAGTLRVHERAGCTDQRRGLPAND